MDKLTPGPLPGCVEAPDAPSGVATTGRADKTKAASGKRKPLADRVEEVIENLAPYPVHD